MNIIRRPRHAEQRFDTEGFRMAFGIGIVLAAMGTLIAWGTLTAPEGESGSSGFTLTQRLARALPHSVQEKIALGLSFLFIIFGAVMILLAMKLVVVFAFKRIAGDP